MLEDLTWDIGTESPRAEALQDKLDEFMNYITANIAAIPNYADRHRHGEPIATGFVEYRLWAATAAGTTLEMCRLYVVGSPEHEALARPCTSCLILQFLFCRPRMISTVRTQQVELGRISH